MRPSQERLDEIKKIVQIIDGNECFIACKDLLAEIQALQEENRKIVNIGNWALFENEELLEALEVGLRGLVWLIEGPYGESPSLDDLKNVRAVLKKHENKIR